MGSTTNKPLTWWQLSLLGVACTIGTGFFLGSSIAIDLAGPAVLIAYVMAAIGTYCVYEALSKLMIDNPQKGSFRTYAKNAYGRWAGFSSGWVYWASEMLIIGSQLTAISIFSQFWFPNIQIWVFASIYAGLALLVILIGPKGFDRVENVLAVLKAAAILMFIILAVLALFGLFGPNAEPNPIPRTIPSLFPNGITGLLPALIFGFYGFGGIEIMSLLAIRLKNMNEAPKSGKVMLLLLILIYILSLSFAMLLVNWDQMNIDESPFVTALNQYNINYVQDIFNGVFIIAGFSTMVASLFAVIRILVTLAEDQDAPKLFAKKIKNKLELPAILLTTSGIIVSIILSIVMPDNIYEFVTTAAGLMLLYNWLFILASFGRLLTLKGSEQFKRILGSLFILIAIFGTLFHHTSRPGFLLSIVFLVVIAIVTFIMNSRWKKSSSDDESTLFKKL